MTNKYKVIVKVKVKNTADELLIQSDITTDKIIKNNDMLIDVCDKIVKDEFKKQGLPLYLFDDYSAMAIREK